MASLRTAAFALALLGSTMMIGQASAAMPVNGLTPAKAQIANNIQEARWGWRYCRWGYGHRHLGYGYGYRRFAWGYGPGWRGCGWHRCWW
jgi:hypothetical protein